ncbi:LysR family transcriptional regulator [Endozoicomonas ascidiicola]|uniref:LysR family transcriptional regulator n=1 Tax=Endozoicomonas ascidiicola TaxID=1698521 RepID=UPI00082E084B|nr:LysR family transcriptional regulator [Endozoicomonas ascidiicola]
MFSSSKPNLSRIDLNLLTALEALLDERSVTKAAGRLFIGQPAMSHHLGRLRELFDDPLLVRQGSTMKLTRRASELQPMLRKILDQVRNDLLPVQHFEPALFSGHIKIGLTDYAESLYAEAIVEALRFSAPESSVSFILVGRDSAFAGFQKGLLDIAIGSLGNGPAELAMEKLYTEKHVCLFDNRQLKLNLPLSYEDFLSVDHALINNTGFVKGIVDDLLAERGDKRKVRVTCGRFTSLLRLLPGEPLISVVPRVLAALGDPEQMLTASPCPVAVPDFDIYLAWRREDHDNLLLKWLRKLVGSVVRERRALLLPHHDTVS